MPGGMFSFDYTSDIAPAREGFALNADEPFTNVVDVTVLIFAISTLQLQTRPFNNWDDLIAVVK